MNRKKLYIPSLILYIFVILSVSIFGAPLGGMTAADQSDISKLQYAASQHEIISILIDEGDWNQAVAEFYKILDLDLGVKSEPGGRSLANNGTAAAGKTVRFCSHGY
jgi:hypothetical protein